jgi:hypothetical protein
MDGPSVDYAFLSAAWGDRYALRLTSNNHKDFEDAISLDAIPKTIQDAIYVARALRIRYLWVDSLCILQDSSEDWAREASYQPDYLQGSSLTLAAASSRAVVDGFLSPREETTCYVFVTQHLEGLSRIYLRKARVPVCQEVFDEPLLSRLWTLQELTLSPRTIYFTSSGLLWNCFKHSIADDSVAEHKNIWKERLGFDLSSAEDDLSTAEVCRSWHQIVEHASQLQVAFARDRLPALAALASVTARRLKGDVYLAGLWRRNLLRDLLWHSRVPGGLKRVDAFNQHSLPTWTWAAYSGKIDYSLLGSSKHDHDEFRPISRVLQYPDVSQNDRPYVFVDVAKSPIVLHATVLPYYNVPTDGSSEYTGKFCIDSLQEAEQIMETTLRSERLVVIIGSTAQGTSSRLLHALVVQQQTRDQDEQTPNFCRIGAGFVQVPESPDAEGQLSAAFPASAGAFETVLGLV